MATTLDYADIPPYATRLQSTDPSSHTIRPAPKVLTSLPNPNNHHASSTTPIQPTSPTKGGFNMMIPQMLLSSTFQIPEGHTSIPHSMAAATASTSPRTTISTASVPLLSTRDPLSIPTTTINFKRFVSKSGPVFWFQDRVEEVVMWRRGWKVTGVWMACYAFLCARPLACIILLLS
jgi:hypothetical protein